MKWINTETGQHPVIETYGCEDSELAPLLDWCDTLFFALSRLRGAQWRLDGSRDAKTLADLYTCINDLNTRLEPRLSGVIEALTRAHYAAGGSHGELANAMDVTRATAQTRATKVRMREPSHWANWAAGELAPVDRPATEIRPGWVLITTDGQRHQVREVRVYSDGYVEVQTGGQASFCFEAGDPATVIPKGSAEDYTSGTGTYHTDTAELTYEVHAFDTRETRRPLPQQ
ncbi:hypothetical protein [Amycolatopsis thermoflava]|uniref:hypothetical protein n=1 Tax=Amycolatopsis thermoflava TaxID=84480 RepID=UPI000407A0C1|nr:hypothetical protein [Amycolatopsis thermoflava]